MNAGVASGALGTDGEARGHWGDARGIAGILGAAVVAEDTDCDEGNDDEDDRNEEVYRGGISGGHDGWFLGCRGSIGKFADAEEEGDGSGEEVNGRIGVVEVAGEQRNWKQRRGMRYCD